MHWTPPRPAHEVRFIAADHGGCFRLVHVAALRIGDQFLIDGLVIAVSTGRGTTLTPINPRK